jgi:hypothetical protein
MREEFETLDCSRKFSRRVVADLLEVCAVCGCPREKCRLVRCRWCEDSYYCADGLCFHQHQAKIITQRSPTRSGKSSRTSPNSLKRRRSL